LCRYMQQDKKEGPGQMPGAFQVFMDYLPAVKFSPRALPMLPSQP
jgi:hypothetical protein